MGYQGMGPGTFKTTSLGSEDVEIYYPRRYTDLIKVPFIFYVKESGILKAVYCQGNASASGDNFNIKQGVGSVNIAASAISDKADFMIGGKQLSVSLTKISNPE